MLLEFAIHDLEYKDIEIKNILSSLKNYNLNYLSLFK